MRNMIALTMLAVFTMLLVLGPSGNAGTGLGAARNPRWSGCFYAENDGGPRQLITVNLDGTWSANDTNDFGVPLGDRDGTIHGVWEATGPFEAVLTGLWMQFDENGIHTATLRVTAVSQTDKDFDTFSNSMTVDFFLPSQNPALEEPFQYNVASFTGTGWRVTGD